MVSLDPMVLKVPIDVEEWHDPKYVPEDLELFTDPLRVECDPLKLLTDPFTMDFDPLELLVDPFKLAWHSFGPFKVECDPVRVDSDPVRLFDPMSVDSDPVRVDLDPFKLIYNEWLNWRMKTIIER